MSEQEKTAEPAQEAPEAEVQQPPQETAQEPEGKQFIDFKDLPPQVEARFRRIYGNMKEYERVVQEHAKVNRALVDRLEKLETGDFQKRVDTLQDQRKQAWESGDFDKASRLDDELLDYKLAAKERAKSKPAEVVVPQFKDDPIPAEYMDRLGAWASEAGDDGKPLRPWANPKHPQHKRALHAIQSAVLDPDLYDVDTGEGFENVLKHVDGKMGKTGQANHGTAAVLSGNGDVRPQKDSKSVRLSPEEVRVAEGMGYTPKQYAEIKQKYGVK